VAKVCSLGRFCENVKNTKLLCTGYVSGAQNAPKLVFGWESATDPAGEVYDALLDPLSIPLTLDAFGISTDSTATSFSTN